MFDAIYYSIKFKELYSFWMLNQILLIFINWEARVLKSPFREHHQVWEQREGKFPGGWDNI